MQNLTAAAMAAASSAAPFLLLNYSANSGAEDAEDFAGVDEEAEQYDGNVMNRPVVKAFFLMAYILVFVSSVVGNSMVLICIVANRSMRTVTNFFLANLAIADLLVGIFCVCQNAVHFVLFAHGTWPFGRVLCHAYVYILHMIPNSSAGILVLLSVERFIAVLRPMLVHHLMTKSVLILCTVLVWTLSALMNVPYLIAVQYMDFYNAEAGQHYGICTRRHLVWSDVNVLQLVSTVNLTIWYVLPLTLLLSIYASIGLVLIRTTEDDSVARTSQLCRTSGASSSSALTGRQSAPSLKAGLGPNANSGLDSEYSLLNGSTGTGPQLHKHSAPPLSSSGMRKLSQLSQLGSRQLNRTGSNCLDIGNGNGTVLGHVRRLPKIELVDSRRRVIRLCAVIVLAFAVLSLPRYIYLTWSVWREANAPRCLNCLSALVQPTTFLLMFLASGINPLLYAFLSQRFRAAIRDTFSFRKGREQQRKEQMLLLLRNHRLSEQLERDAFGAPIARTLSSNGSSANGASYRQQQQQQKRNGRTATVGGEEPTLLETVLDTSEAAELSREKSCAF